MKCPYCGNNCADEALYCDICKQPLPTKEGAPENNSERVQRSRLQKILIVLCWVACFAILAVGIYKLVFWIDSYKITRLYTRGAYTPTLNEVTMEDGRKGHALIFYGEDGDMVYFPELDKSLSICGGIARLEVADSEWFGSEAGDYDRADIEFAPVLMKQDGTQIQLPVVSYSIDVPASPLNVVSPASNDISVVTSIYPLEIQVVPGSSLFVNGEDLTERLDRSGAFSGEVSVQPIGENTYTVIVRTPRHKETRHDITIYREQFDINIELDDTISTQSSDTAMEVTGTVEPGAFISVETPYIEESLQLDMNTGKFAFIAKLDKLGENIIRFRATMEGRDDAVISLAVNYKPTLAQYSAKAWRMDYDQLKLYFENWLERVFLCKGSFVDKFTDEGTEYMVMDVGRDGTQQLVVLENQTSISPSLGPVYSAYAHVTGRYYYGDKYYPMLCSLYMDLEGED